ncbi:MAG TPA: glucosamine-6-phosphate deaminase [Vicinamibacterales bacterium]|nr:glucosamine-6-phosphate deaminase [Vicinamibacterales bacterium]
MRLRVFATAQGAARALASEIARELRANPRLVLGLPTGRTPIPLYRELAAMCGAGRSSFARATTFNLDEFVGIGSRDPRGYHAFMRRHLFDRIDIAPLRVHFLNGLARDAVRECARYERAIARAGGIDLQILGLGSNGHIGFNEPGRALVAPTHRTRLRPSTRRANAALFSGRIRDVPREALSMGMATILGARRIVLLATGASKARCVQRMVQGPVTPRLPASFLQLHPDAQVWVDAAAAARLT